MAEVSWLVTASVVGHYCLNLTTPYFLEVHFLREQIYTTPQSCSSLWLKTLCINQFCTSMSSCPVSRVSWSISTQPLHAQNCNHSSGRSLDVERCHTWNTS